jgi:hypothetical protein
MVPRQVNRILVLLAWTGIAWSSMSAAQAQAGNPSPPSSYVVDETFQLEMPPGLKTLGAVIGVRVAADGNLWVFHRCVHNSCAAHPAVPPLLEYSPSGRLLRSLGAGAFVWPHALHIDGDGNLWLSDAVADNGRNPDAPGRGHQVFKLGRDGAILMTLGKAGIPGNGTDTFFAPSDVVVAANGDVFVADGHGAGTNTRVMKFGKDGKFLKQWGTYGVGPGEFRLPHTIAMDSQGRVFVGDRPNNRIQIFDQSGRFLAEWKQFGRPSSVFIDRNDVIYVTDTQSTDGRPGFRNGIYIGSAKDGKVTGFIPKVDERSNMEGIGATPDGSVLYGADIGLEKVVKFVRK